MPSATSSQGFAVPEQEAAFIDILRRAEDQFQTGGPRFPGFPTFVPQSRETLDALGGISDVARQGDPLTQAALGRTTEALQGDFSRSPGLNALAQTASGQFLSPDSNPFLRQIFNRQVAPGIQDNVNSSFIGRGRFGSAANTRVLADSLGNAANELFGQNFARERGLQNQAGQQLANEQFRQTALAPQLSEARFADLGRLANVGAAREAQSGAQLEDRLNRFNFGQNRPIENLARLQSFTLGGPVPLSETNPVFSNRGAGILGAGLAGAGIGGKFGGFGGSLLGGGVGALAGGLLL